MFLVPRGRRRRFGAALSPGEAALSLEMAILSSRPRRRRRRGPVAGRPHSCGTKQGAHAGGNCRWPLHQQRRRCDSRASAISAAPNGLRASTATSEPTPDAKRPPTPKRSPGGVAAAPPNSKHGPLQGADAGDSAQRDITREDAGHVSTLYPKELQTELGGIHRQESHGDDAAADDARVCWFDS